MHVKSDRPCKVGIEVVVVHIDEADLLLDPTLIS